MEQRPSKLVVILIILAIVFSLVGATFAYLTVSIVGNNNVDVTSYNFNVVLSMNRVDPVTAPLNGYGLILLDETDLASAVSAGCVDDDGYTACMIWELEFTNNGSDAITLSGELTPITNTFSNLKYSVTAIGGAKSSLTFGSPLGSASVTAGFTNLTIPTGTSQMYLMLYVNNLTMNQMDDAGKIFAGSLTFNDPGGGSQLYAEFNTLTP